MPRLIQMVGTTDISVTVGRMIIGKQLVHIKGDTAATLATGQEPVSFKWERAMIRLA